jgi:hypothetical protein
MKNNWQTVKAFFIQHRYIGKGTPVSLIISVLFLFLFPPLTAQVVYTDKIPDYHLQGNVSTTIDINSDGIFDLQFVCTYVHEDDVWKRTVKIYLFGSTEVAVADGDASAILINDVIDGSGNITWSTGGFLHYIWLHGGDSGYYYGNWFNVSSGFVGVRIKIGQQYHYAWIRIYADPINSLWIADWAYNTIDNQMIVAGQGLPLCATSVLGEDTSNFFDGRDIRVTFTKAFYESDFSEYRVILAKADDSTALDLDVMNQLPVDRYHSVLIDSTNSTQRVTLNLTATTVDKDGDLVKQFTDYRLHILNVSSLGNAEDWVLSVPSSVFKLQAFTGATQEPLAWDDSDNNSSTDIRVSFPKIAEENFLSEYRIIVIPAFDTAVYNVDTALTLTEEYYTRVLPQGTDVLVSLNANQKVFGGDLVKEGVFYQVYVLSVADGVHSITSALSTPSRRIILQNPGVLMAGQQTGSNLNYFECDSQFSPNTHWVEPSSHIDVNRDGVMDYTIYFHYQESGGIYSVDVHITPERNNLILVCDHTEHENWIDVLEKNQSIGEGYHWVNETAILLDTYSSSWVSGGHSYGHYSGFSTDQPIYIGFCVMDHENPQYVWLYLKKSDYISYAFEDVNSGIDQHSTSKVFQIFPNPASEYFQIQRLGSNSLKEDYSVSWLIARVLLLMNLGLKVTSCEKILRTTLPVFICWCFSKKVS